MEFPLIHVLIQEVVLIQSESVMNLIQLKLMKVKVSEKWDDPRISIRPSNTAENENRNIRPPSFVVGISGSASSGVSGSFQWRHGTYHWIYHFMYFTKNLSPLFEFVKNLGAIIAECKPA
jgi:hypothetical protein